MYGRLYYNMKENKGHTITLSGYTYKIRSENFIEDSILFIPSYTKTGDSFNIEKSKRKMIAECENIIKCIWNYGGEEKCLKNVNPGRRN